MEGKGDKATAEGMELLRKEVEKMKEELKTSEEGLYTFACKNICSGSALQEKWCDHCRGLQVLLKIIGICVLASSPALKNSQSEADVMKKQMEGLAREYDRLLKEHQELQVTLTLTHSKDTFWRHVPPCFLSFRCQAVEVWLLHLLLRSLFVSSQAPKSINKYNRSEQFKPKGFILQHQWKEKGENPFDKLGTANETWTK